jgi:hypothetical protein
MRQPFLAELKGRTPSRPVCRYDTTGAITDWFAAFSTDVTCERA